MFKILFAVVQNMWVCALCRGSSGGSLAMRMEVEKGRWRDDEWHWGEGGVIRWGDCA